MIIDKNVKLLADMLNTPSAEQRLVVYNGIAEVVAGKLVKTIEATGDYEMRMRMYLKKVVDAVGEIAIIDRSLFENTLVNVLKFKLNKVDVDVLAGNLYQARGFLDIIGVGAFYSETTIETIEKNLVVYKNAIATTNLAHNALFDFNN